MLLNQPRKGERRINQWERRLAAPIAIIVESATRVYPKDIALGDFDADGDLDVATANWGTNRLSILRNKGDATFHSPLVYEAGFRPESIRVSDLDGDARQDVAVANGNGDVNIFLNRSRAPFSRDNNRDGQPDECVR